VASSKDLIVLSASHSFGGTLASVYGIAGIEVEVFPASRMLYALGAAHGLCSDSSKICLHPTEGVLTRDQLGNQAKFGVGVKGSWEAVNIFSKTAKLIVDFLKQDKSEEITLLSLPSSSNFRMVRGGFSVSFKGF
jgi:hypothetical protein